MYPIGIFLFSDYQLMITLVCPLFFGITSARLLQNLSKGLRNHGFELAFVSLYASKENMNALRPFGKVYTSHILDTMPARLAVKDWMFNNVSGKLLNLFEKYCREIKDSVGMLTTSAFGGDLSLIRSRKKGLFRSIGWFYDNPPGILDLSSKVVRTGRTRWENFAFNLLSSMTPLLSKHFWRVQEFDFVIASTKWVANILNYMTGCEVDEVIYPPIDTERFKPTPLENTIYDDKWCLSVGRKNEIKTQNIKKLAREVTVVRSGQDRIEEAKNVGYTSNEQLVSLYSSAYFTLFPTMLEPAGYIPLESMACGTPVLTYRWQGPGETVINNKTGWVVSNSKEFFEKGLELWSDGYDPKMRKNCRRHVIKNFSIKTASEKLSKIIKKVVR